MNGCGTTSQLLFIGCSLCWGLTHHLLQSWMRCKAGRSESQTTQQMHWKHICSLVKTNIRIEWNGWAVSMWSSVLHACIHVNSWPWWFASPTLHPFGLPVCHTWRAAALLISLCCWGTSAARMAHLPPANSPMFYNTAHTTPLPCYPFLFAMKKLLVPVLARAAAYMALNRG